MGNLEHDHNHWSLIPGRGGAVVRVQPDPVLFSRTHGRQRSMGCVDVGMVNILPTARIQLCGHPGSKEPPPTLGRQASGGSGLEVRVMLPDLAYSESRTETGTSEAGL